MLQKKVTKNFTGLNLNYRQQLKPYHCEYTQAKYYYVRLYLHYIVVKLDLNYFNPTLRRKTNLPLNSHLSPDLTLI